MVLWNQPDGMTTHGMSIRKRPSFPMQTGKQEHLVNNRFTISFRARHSKKGPNT